MRRFCTWQAGSGAHLDDLVQETFIRAHKGIGGFRSAAPAVSWLLSIARRVCLDHFSRLRRELPRSGTLPSDSFPSTTSDPVLAVELADLVARLPLSYREAFVLVRVFGLSYEEAASVLGCPRGTVQSRVARARVILVATMGEALQSAVS